MFPHQELGNVVEELQPSLRGISARLRFLWLESCSSKGVKSQPLVYKMLFPTLGVLGDRNCERGDKAANRDVNLRVRRSRS